MCTWRTQFMPFLASCFQHLSVALGVGDIFSPVFCSLWCDVWLVALLRHPSKLGNPARYQSVIYIKLGWGADLMQVQAWRRANSWYLVLGVIMSDMESDSKNDTGEESSPDAYIRPCDANTSQNMNPKEFLFIQLKSFSWIEVNV
ncbi:hypothetical protein F5J12DRAFT_787249 [Pisolithus orientalis]|uniref:uncharacterized protein n=1 Tax=Pisolithus orientalis TaxID=936130 RepID=UPI0022247C20|nr:uncharacterized protein F5J12DRAFT_787249 [Pisolithus orientalis]KAI5986304.1 hypothetical protein F5J12DRAFT_787249 [Pisolithus orientalis]